MVARIGIPAALFLLSACLTISLLYIIFPRQPAAPKVIVPKIPLQKEAATPETIYSSPVRLEITKASVIAPVVAVGLTQDGAMDIGKAIEKTAWYKLGPKPGEKGSAVIAGHYGWLNGQGSVFNNLHTLRPGDKISVYDEKDLTINFIVREIRNYNLNADTMDVFKSTDKKAHLNLITCGGLWDYPRQTYSDRLVIFSDLEI